ncbi:MAG: hypothetical protein U0353_06110 [Sandaracinus sp.]
MAWFEALSWSDLSSSSRGALCVPTSVVLAWLSSGCPSELSCGPGTHVEGSVCVPDGVVDAGPSDAGPVTLVDAPGADVPGADAHAMRLEEGDPCPTDGAGFTTLSPTCDGDDLLYCSGAFVRRTDCTVLGDRCVPGGSPDALPRCDGGVYVACDVATSIGRCADEGNTLRCASGYPNAPGFTYTIPCATFGDGYSCMMGATEGGCVPPGTVACDPAMPSSACSADGSSIVRCSDGLEYTIPCESRLAGSVCDLGPGTEPVCVPRGAMRCESRTFHGSCVGDGIVERCDPVTAHVALASCGAGTRCRVSDLGFAACVPDESRPCDPDTAVARCFDAERLALCDARGWEASHDCTLSAPGARCIPSTPARCGVAEVCDVATYTAHCDGEMALNCREGGWVEVTSCSPFVPCRVTGGVAGCGG